MEWTTSSFRAASHLHRHALRDSRPHHVLLSRAPQVVWNVSAGMVNARPSRFFVVPAASRTSPPAKSTFRRASGSNSEVMRQLRQVSGRRTVLGKPSRDRGAHENLSIGYDQVVTWKEVIRKLKAAGFVEKRTGKGSHLLF